MSEETNVKQIIELLSIYQSTDLKTLNIEDRNLIKEDLLEKKRNLDGLLTKLYKSGANPIDNATEINLMENAVKDIDEFIENMQYIENLSNDESEEVMDEIEEAPEIIDESQEEISETIDDNQDEETDEESDEISNIEGLEENIESDEEQVYQEEETDYEENLYNFAINDNLDTDLSEENIEVEEIVEEDIEKNNDEELPEEDIEENDDEEFSEDNIEENVDEEFLENDMEENDDEELPEEDIEENIDEENLEDDFDPQEALNQEFLAEYLANREPDNNSMMQIFSARPNDYIWGLAKKEVDKRAILKIDEITDAGEKMSRSLMRKIISSNASDK